ncbi:hypothetical protein M431DRAFT_433371 [Trichoderma harzianum CBS 226.95]|uniref:Secreted protein n=1 Tax=Trichoderma harzianum CBS 226.95 TaxID=983964 RepID=A0A2T4ACV0_TRIHA|nr:hypothetical protein M431DRAFT_433371 [Trichoderma harzianum CBS 226.95]PTB54915.1 hypothetical protein M431DRAFT_433371 [Trichoderma harzianum CBS 226.95]
MYRRAFLCRGIFFLLIFLVMRARGTSPIHTRPLPFLSDWFPKIIVQSHITIGQLVSKPTTKQHLANPIRHSHSPCFTSGNLTFFFFFCPCVTPHHEKKRASSPISRFPKCRVAGFQPPPALSPNHKGTVLLCSGSYLPLYDGIFSYYHSLLVSVFRLAGLCSFHSR